MKNLKVSVRDYQSAIAAESDTCDQLIDAQQVQLEVVLRETAELERIQRRVDESLERIRLMRVQLSCQASPSLPLGGTYRQRSEDIATAKGVVTEADQNYAAQVYGQQLGQGQNRVLQAVKGLGPSWVTAHRVAVHIGSSENAAFRVLATLYNSNLVEMDHNGTGYVWRLAEVNAA